MKASHYRNIDAKLAKEMATVDAQARALSNQFDAIMDRVTAGIFDAAYCGGRVILFENLLRESSPKGYTLDPAQAQRPVIQAVDLLSSRGFQVSYGDAIDTLRVSWE